MNKVIFFVCYICCYIVMGGGVRPIHTSGTFDVRSYGARGDGRTDNSKAFMAAWKAACSSSSVVKMLIPRGTYYLGPVEFHGPCKNVQSITVYMKGYLKALTDLRQYAKGDHWVQFAWVDKLTLTGGGTFDGQGASSWPFNKCTTSKNCKLLPTSIKFVTTTNTIVKGIKSVNSKFFHIAVVNVDNFQGSNIQITAPKESPNTDGIHIDRSSGVTLYSSIIGTGDDCISIGQGNSNILISGITCGPGHGISVGSLGKYKTEKDVRGLIVRNCNFVGTSNGIRIKTWANSPLSTVASNMTFDNIIMKNVANPIIINQAYCPYSSCNDQWPSRVKISDIYFKNIRGTSTTPIAVMLRCSRGWPCKNINLNNVQLKYVGNTPSTATCSSVKASYTGTQIPPPCG